MTTGFGTNAAVFLQATGRLDPSSLPAADATLGDSAAVMLVDLDAPTPGRVPLLVDFKTRQTTFRPGNLLALLPYPGHPLRGQTRYAAIAFGALRDEAGRPLAPAPLLDALDSPWDATKPGTQAQWNALRQQRDDVFAYVTRNTSWSPDAVVAFTVFTTQDVRSEMVAIAAGVEALPVPTPVFRTTGSCAFGGPVTVSGQLDLPKWQTGAFPYANDGGAIEIVNGVAVQQSTERVDFEMTYRCGIAPPDGWPVLLFMDGTGGCPRSRFIPYFGPATPPYMVLSISPLYSCDRAPQAGNTEFLYFNFLNPIAGRTISSSRRRTCSISSGSRRGSFCPPPRPGREGRRSRPTMHAS